MGFWDDKDTTAEPFTLDLVAKTMAAIWPEDVPLPEPWRNWYFDERRRDA